MDVRRTFLSESIVAISSKSDFAEIELLFNVDLMGLEDRANINSYIWFCDARCLFFNKTENGQKKVVGMVILAKKKLGGEQNKG